MILFFVSSISDQAAAAAAAMLMAMQAAAKLASAINTVGAEIFQNQIQNTVRLSSVAD